MKVVVVGGGKMGLPLACQIASNGADVTVCDINLDLIEKINRSEAPFFEPGLQESLARNVAANRLRASIDTSDLVSRANVVIIIVPAVLTPANEIDYGNLKSASEAVGKGLQKGILICYETTVPVGGCRSELVPVLEKTSGLKAGKDFYVAFSPERVKSMKVFEHLSKIPKINGGFDAESAQKAKEFYKKYLKVPIIDLKTMENAEFVKLAGMLYRDVNIALANELAFFAEKVGADFMQIREAANTDGEAKILLPGIGVGGHCTPVYPYFLISSARKIGLNLHLAENARSINDQQPTRMVSRIIKKIGPISRKKVHILGLAFRPNVKEHFKSPAFLLHDALQSHNAVISLEDPLYSKKEIESLGFQYAQIVKDPAEIVILTTAHEQYKNPNFKKWYQSGVRLVVDGRNYWNEQDVADQGIGYLTVGKSSEMMRFENRQSLIAN